MNKVYIATDYAKSKIYIAPFGRVSTPYLIVTKNRGEADKIALKINATLIKTPLEKPELYELIETQTDLIIKGVVKVFRLIE